MSLRAILSNVLTLVFLTVASSSRAQPRCEGAQVLLSVDRSSSMVRTPHIDGMTKWAVAQEAVSSVVNEFADRIDFGLQVFPVPSECSPGEVVLDIGTNDAASILDALGEPPPYSGNYTPLQETLYAAVQYEPLLDSSRDSHLVLITDGYQWCGDADLRNELDLVDAVEALVDHGVTVHVIGFGAGVDVQTLNRAAAVGGASLPGCNVEGTSATASDHCYQQADDLYELQAALDGVARSITDEACDGFDNDCDGIVDEGFDADEDSYTRCGTNRSEVGVVEDGLIDCNDEDATIHPGASEECDSIDNNCDGMADPECECLEGTMQSCGNTVGACEAGLQACVDGTWAVCEGSIPEAARRATESMRTVMDRPMRMSSVRPTTRASREIVST